MSPVIALPLASRASTSKLTTSPSRTFAFAGESSASRPCSAPRAPRSTRDRARDRGDLRAARSERGDRAVPRDAHGTRICSISTSMARARGHCSWRSPTRSRATFARRRSSPRQGARDPRTAGPGTPRNCTEIGSMNGAEPGTTAKTARGNFPTELAISQKLPAGLRPHPARLASSRTSPPPARAVPSHRRRAARAAPSRPR